MATADRKPRSEYLIQGLFEYGYETVTTEDSYKVACGQLEVYRQGDPDHQYKLKKVVIND